MTTKFSYTRGGEPWAPQFIEAIDEQKCIGCGRCFKVCSRNVFDLIEKEEIGEEDDYDEMMMVMTLKDQMDCIGCMSCAKVCPKNCQTFTAPAA
ncbi:ferredoxin III, nif-specific [Vibrio cincinnatiensis]|nr:ferredoxin III, nif-specific [Vibrio cincinnatiensis]MCG3724269.1 ferredoxin III, nif-specific [Vibrio cincinnatiensis]MCG3731355.1 ferredoxin III, nif-specific [Vibrio cincinnatiensis]MCG3738868.1 ferredoxin III, nif-specific [Vibrio cincinnatiensis]MCG3742278.1 ferredoxin III, nif-specific [Vibrio cincinnatiensis]